ncbi:5'-nucleotidase C-terminal domain-containing protein [Xanthovirga aplysinae]|uniref:5'-nucleotidase C-terminal domain-containing protein n=1 Tax=Xanthovirga aplysinae TaxID=2529853 RepID=UPI0012BB729B|nr:5'-nucleotidase [Xanthovirga aplysinae]MTI30948.1 nucleotide phosphoesterase [Xanthovirga aplysinae]
MWKKNVLFLLSLIFLFSCSPKIKKTSYKSNAQGVQVNKGIEADSAISAMVKPYKKKVDAEMHQYIGKAAKTLTVQPVESTLGNFVADLTQEMGSAYLGQSVDLGAITIGGLRTPLTEGPLEVEDIFELMPFENTIYILRLNAQQLRELFDYLVKHKNLAVSNSVVVTSRKGEVKRLFIGGQPFDANRTYTLAISDYLANGGDKMRFLKDAERVKKLNVLYRDAIIEYIRKLDAEGKVADAQIEGRVKIQD